MQRVHAGVARRPGGDKEETIAVRVPIKPARLIVVGDVDKTYQIDEHPELTVRVGANSIPMSSQFDPVHVKQLETGARAPVRLEAGKQVEATF